MAARKPVGKTRAKNPQEGSPRGSPDDLQARERDVRALLARDGVVKLSTIKPKQLRDGLLSRLAAEGFDVTRTCVRRPPRAELERALQHGALVDVKSLATYVPGVSSSELKELVSSAVKEGRARRALRGKAEVLCGPETAVLTALQLVELKANLSTLGKQVDKASKARALTLVSSDVEAALSTALAVLKPAQLPTRTEPAASGDALLAVLEAVDAACDTVTGLAFVPMIVRRLSSALPPAKVSSLLLHAAARDLLELRPEGGVQRLSAEDLSLCPPGPHGTRLSWARRLSASASSSETEVRQ